MVLGDDVPVYLIDFGLVCRFQYRDGTHKEYTADGRKADVGTLEYSGRDAHIGGIVQQPFHASVLYLFIALFPVGKMIVLQLFSTNIAISDC